MLSDHLIIWSSRNFRKKKINFSMIRKTMFSINHKFNFYEIFHSLEPLEHLKFDFRQLPSLIDSHKCIIVTW